MTNDLHSITEINKIILLRKNKKKKEVNIRFRIKNDCYLPDPVFYNSTTFKYAIHIA